MNKSELIDALAKRTGLTKADASRFLEAHKDIIIERLKAGDDVVQPGFGSWSVAMRAERLGRNPQTGATIKIKATRVAKFRAGKALKEAVQK